MTFLKRATFLVLMGASVGSAEARTVQPPSYKVEILIDGVVQPQIVDGRRGKSYVEARAGKEYAIRVSNPTSRRIAAAVAVDGLNAFDAKSTSAEAAVKWVVKPYDSITISGWQVSKDRLRRFVFTTEEASYGKSIGKTDDLGTISVAVFREKFEPQIVARKSASRTNSKASQGASSGLGGFGSGQANSAPALAATAQGRSEAHAVRMVDLELESSSVATFAIRYEFNDALVRLGVLPRPSDVDAALARREKADGFQNVEFAPEQK